MSKVMSREAARAYSLEQLLSEVNETQEAVRVVMEDGKEIEIAPAKPRLKPLTRLSGNVAEGWKEAIYEPKPSLMRK